MSNLHQNDDNSNVTNRFRTTYVGCITLECHFEFLCVCACSIVKVLTMLELGRVYSKL